MARMLKTIILAFIFGILGGALGNYLFDSESQEDLIKDFYDTENAVHVSPHSIRKHIGDNTFILVDLRSEEEYKEEHIIGAVNIPAYKDKDTSDYGAVERITNEFKELKKANPEQDIIVYCYSIPCMTGRKVGQMLAEQNIYVKHLGIGWNEWRYHWTLWNHQHEWNQTNVENYIHIGPEPGVFTSNKSKACPIDGSLGC